MKNDLKKLSRAGKTASTHAFVDLGFSVRQIAEILGIGKNTVVRYKNEEIQDDWVQYKDAVKKTFTLKENEIAAKALQTLDENMIKANYSDVVKVYSTLKRSGKSDDNNITNQFNQVNINQNGNEETREIAKRYEAEIKAILSKKGNTGHYTIDEDQADS